MRFAMKFRLLPFVLKPSQDLALPCWKCCSVIALQAHCRKAWAACVCRLPGGEIKFLGQEIDDRRAQSQPDQQHAFKDTARQLLEVCTGLMSILCKWLHVRQHAVLVGNMY